MTRFRRTLILLLIATIPLQGIAALDSFQVACSTNEKSMSQRLMTSAAQGNVKHAMHSMGAMTDSQDSCCPNDKMAMKNCKAPQDCHVAQPSIATVVPVLIVVRPVQYLAAKTIPFKPLSTLVAIWRPPSPPLFA